MNPVELPTNPIGLAGLVVITAGGWVKAWIDSRRHDRGVAETRDQIRNSHATNLRDDEDKIGRIVAEVRDELRDQRRDIGGLRQDLSALRGELRDEREARGSARTPCRGTTTPRQGQT
jgi:hypothetical protein